MVIIRCHKHGLKDHHWFNNRNNYKSQLSFNRFELRVATDPMPRKNEFGKEEGNERRAASRECLRDRKVGWWDFDWNSVLYYLKLKCLRTRPFSILLLARRSSLRKCLKKSKLPKNVNPRLFRIHSQWQQDGWASKTWSCQIKLRKQPQQRQSCRFDSPLKRRDPGRQWITTLWGTAEQSTLQFM